MNTVAITSAVHSPSTSSAGKSSGALRQGSGMCHKASTLIIATANTAERDHRTQRQRPSRRP